MANTKVTALTADTSPTSDDLIPTVTDPAGTPASRKVTLANAITKAHGLSDGIVKVASGTMATASSGTDYAPATSGTGILKGNGSGGFSTATANTDYFAPKAKLDATTAPGSSNDNTQGYAVGSVWVDVTNDKSYIAVDVSTGAAVWNDLTASAAGGINNIVEDLTPQLGGDLDLNSKNITAGAATVSPTELGYLDGVTSAIQGQIDGKQPLDADLTTIAGLTATTDSFLQSKSSAWTTRTPTQVTADLIAMVGDSGSGGTKGLVPAPAAGDAAAGKYLKADGTWATAGGTQVHYQDIGRFDVVTAAEATGVELNSSGTGTADPVWSAGNLCWSLIPSSSWNSDAMSGIQIKNNVVAGSGFSIFDTKLRISGCFKLVNPGSNNIQSFIGLWSGSVTSNTNTPMTMTTKHIGIYGYNNGGANSTVIYGSNANGTTQTSTNLSVSSLSEYNYYTIIYTPGVSAKFYLNGTLAATHTTNLPTGASASTNSLLIVAANTGAQGGGIFEMRLSNACIELGT